MNDVSSTLFALRLVKLVIEVALLALIGQGVVWAMIRATGQPVERNVFYRTLQVVVSPFTKLVRLVTPRVVADRHIPWAVLALLLVGYVWVLFAIANTCIGAGLPVSECRQLH